MEHELVPFECWRLPPDAVALVLAPHPDDEVFGCGGTIAFHVANGGEARVVLLTTGERGGEAQARLAESACAAKLLGIPSPECWYLNDRGLQYGESLVLKILDAISRCRATVLFAPSLWEVHPDHRATALAAFEALRRHGGCDLMAYEVGAPLRPNRLVDITPTLDVKRRAMACFASQYERQRYDLQIEGLNRYRTYTLPEQVQSAEAFEYLSAGRIEQNAMEFFQSEYQRQHRRRLMCMPSDMMAVELIVRYFGEMEPLHETLDSIALQTWGRIQVTVVLGLNATSPTNFLQLPSWCGRFPMRLVDLSREGERVLREIESDLWVILDAGELITPNIIAEAIYAIDHAPPTSVTVLLHGGEEAGDPPEDAKDPLWKWRRDLRMLLDTKRKLLGVYRCSQLDARQKINILHGSRILDRELWLEFFSRGELSSSGLYSTPVYRIGLQLCSMEGHTSTDAIGKFFSSLSDPLLRQIIDAILSGLAKPWITAILDESKISGDNFFDRIKSAARQAAEYKSMMALLDQFAVYGEDLKARFQLALQGYQDMLIVRRKLDAQVNLKGSDWEARLNEACEASQQLAKIKNDLQAIHFSRSWRLTAPLRFFGGVLRRLFRSLE